MQRLTASDATFLYMENPVVHMHVTRQRVVPVPFGIDHPVWVEDPCFDIDHHLWSHTLPSPGSMEQLAAFDHGGHTTSEVLRRVELVDDHIVSHCWRETDSTRSRNDVTASSGPDKR